MNNDSIVHLVLGHSGFPTGRIGSCGVAQSSAITEIRLATKQ